MILRAAFLAQSAIENQDGTFMVWRGGITHFGMTEFPAPLTVALILRWQAEEADRPSRVYTMRIRVVQGGQEHPWLTMPLAFKAPDTDDFPPFVNYIVNLVIRIHEPGQGRIELMVDEEAVMPGIPFLVTPATLPPGLSQPTEPGSDQP